VLYGALTFSNKLTLLDCKGSLRMQIANRKSQMRNFCIDLFFFPPDLFYLMKKSAFGSYDCFFITLQILWLFGIHTHGTTSNISSEKWVGLFSKKINKTHSKPIQFGFVFQQRFFFIYKKPVFCKGGEWCFIAV